MAQWIGVARSNYVKIADVDGLVKALEPFEIEVMGGDANVGKVMFTVSQESDDGGWPTYACAEDGTEIKFDPAIHICPFMEEGQILVMQEVGWEKLRYVTGHAVAYNKAGASTSVNIDDIYAKAAAFFEVKEDDITLAQY